MNHLRNAIRLVIIVFWMIVIGVIGSITTNGGNLFALSWISLLFPAVIMIVAIYIGVLLTIRHWNIK